MKINKNKRHTNFSNYVIVLCILCVIFIGIQEFSQSYPLLSAVFEYSFVFAIWAFLIFLGFYFPIKSHSYFKKTRNICFIFALGMAVSSYIDTLLPENIAYLSFLVFLATIIYILMDIYRYFKLPKPTIITPIQNDFTSEKINIMNMSWQDFEKFVAHLMSLEFPPPEYTIELTQASHDGGVDVFVRNNDLIHSRTIIVQAKQYKNTVNPESVHALLGNMHSKKASEAILVTTSKFGPSSYAFADSEKRIKLIDGDNLLTLLRRHGMDNFYII